MKTTLFLLVAGCGLTQGMAQNAVVINQSGSQPGAGHEVSVVQQGSGNTSVVNQSSGGTTNKATGNRAVINQTGRGSVATVNQGNGQSDSVSSSGQSVNVTQSGGGETIIDQTDGSNTISIRQRGPATPTATPADKKKKGRAGGKRQ